MNTSFDYNIFLIGFMGAGKSTIAKEMEKQLDMRYAEMDQLIAEEEGMSIPKIFEKHGEAYFRDLESRMLQDLQQEKGIIVSCGGGIVVREENKGYMKQNGRVVLLTATPETVYERVKDSDERPILNQNMSVDYIAALQENAGLFMRRQQTSWSLPTARARRRSLKKLLKG